MGPTRPMAPGVFDLPTMVSKFISIGVPLEKAVAMVTVNPTRVFDFGAQIGTLRAGSEPASAPSICATASLNLKTAMA